MIQRKLTAEEREAIERENHHYGAEQRTGTVRGIRAWEIDNWNADHPMLIGHWYRAWPGPGEVVAECHCLIDDPYLPRDDHDVVDPSHGCSWYGWWQLPAKHPHRRDEVTGVIDGYGRVLVGDRGFRSEKARLLGLAPLLAPSEGLMGALERLGRDLDVPIYEDKEALFAEFPVSMQ